MRTWSLRVYDEVTDVTCEADVERALAHLPDLEEDDETEVWLSSFDDGGPGPSLAALVHGAQGWLTYFRFEGDPGLSTRNPAHDGPPKAMLTYTILNGSGEDEFPASWAYPTQRVPPAFLEFYRTGEAWQTMAAFEGRPRRC
jgi:hypothetical protein